MRPRRIGPGAAAICLALAATAARADVAREDVLILSEDGQHFTSYTTLRSDLPRRQFLLPGGATPEDYLYIHPDDFRRQAVSGGTRLTFNGGDYALMHRGRFSDAQLQARGDGRFTFRSWEGEKLDNGHFGKWNAPEPFSDFAYVWVVPDNIEIVDFECNRDGRWRRNGNTLAWSGHDVNNLTFTITFRKRAEGSPPATAATAGTDPEAGTTAAAAGPDTDGERITLDSAVLFPPGSHELTDEGLAVLDALARRITDADPERVIVSGHTDNQPLKAYLRDAYPSNWELSAARATNVVRRLADRGVEPSILEARALGAQRPVADNSTAAGRAENRRIEVDLIGAAERPPEEAKETVAETAGDGSAASGTVEKEKTQPDETPPRQSSEQAPAQSGKPRAPNAFIQ